MVLLLFSLKILEDKCDRSIPKNEIILTAVQSVLEKPFLYEIFLNSIKHLVLSKFYDA